MNPITVVALGPGSPDLLTLGAMRALKAAPRVLARTARHAVLDWLKAEGLRFGSLDSLYRESADFDAFTEAAVGRLLALAEEGPLCYTVADPSADETVRLLIARAPDAVTVLPGVPLAAPMAAASGVCQPLTMSGAVGLVVHNAQFPLCVTELNSRALAGEVKLKLLHKYGEGARLLFFPPGEGPRRQGLDILLEDLDRQPAYDHTAGLVIFPLPLLSRTRFDAEDLLAIMRSLRAPDGCPWDRKQTHQSLARYLVEEANEAAGELLEGNWDGAAEELGDVFLQLAFHAVVGEQYATFGWEDMLAAICLKLIRRHPHVFGDLKLGTAEEVLVNWDRIKEAEKKAGGLSGEVDAIPRSLAPLTRAEKIQKVAGKAGLDWEGALDALQKVPEEAAELHEALHGEGAAEEELGDLLFSCVNVARLMGVSADQALQNAVDKFASRLKWIENAVISDKKSLNLLTSKEIGVYWERSKAVSLDRASKTQINGRNAHE